MSATTTALASSSYCAFVVRVSKPTGLPNANVPVGVVQDDTQIATIWTDASGTAKLCDVSVRPVDIVIGTQDCGLVVIKGVRLAWPETRNLFAVYDQKYCNELTLADHCLLLLRVQDKEGNLLPGALFSSGLRRPEFSDRFGRIFASIRSGQILEGTITKEGLDPIHISEQCPKGEENDAERKVVMQRR